MAWTCPDCKRSFGRRNQSHECAPSGTVDDYFDGRPRDVRDWLAEAYACSPL